RQPARVDQRPPWHVPGRVLSGYAPQRRRLLLPHRRARDDVPRLLDRVPVLRVSERRLGALAELRELVRLSVPIALTQFGFVAMTLVETAAVGRVSVDDLAGAGIGRSVGFATIVVGFGVATG